MRPWIVSPVGICEWLNSGAGVIPVLRLGTPLLCHFIMALGDQWSLDFRVMFRTRLSRGCLAFFLKFFGARQVHWGSEGNGSRRMFSLQISLLHIVSCYARHSMPMHSKWNRDAESLLSLSSCILCQADLSIGQKAQFRLLSHLSLPQMNGYHRTRVNYPHLDVKCPWHPIKSLLEPTKLSASLVLEVSRVSVGAWYPSRCLCIFYWGKQTTIKQIDL